MLKNLYIDCMLLEQQVSGRPLGAEKVEPEKKRHAPPCYECGGHTEILEVDIKKGGKVIRCTLCGLCHLYKKDFLDRWKLQRVWRNPNEPSAKP
jgi:hypothetical protein